MCEEGVLTRSTNSLVTCGLTCSRNELQKTTRFFGSVSWAMPMTMSMVPIVPIVPLGRRSDPAAAAATAGFAALIDPVNDDDDVLRLVVVAASTGIGTLGTRTGMEFSGDPFRNDGTTFFAPPCENRCVNSFFLRSTSANMASMLLLALVLPLLLLPLLGATNTEFTVLLDDGDTSVVVCRKKNPINRITIAAMNTAIAFSWLKGDGVRPSLSVSSVSASSSAAAAIDKRCFDFLTFVLRIVDV